MPLNTLFWDSTKPAQANPYHSHKTITICVSFIGRTPIMMLEFHYVVELVQSAQSLALGRALISSFPSSSVVHWRKGLMESGTGHGHMEVLWGLIYNFSFQKHEYSRLVHCSLDINTVLKKEIILYWAIELQLQWLIPRLPLQSQGSNFGPVIFKFDMYSKIINWTSFYGHGEGRNCGVVLSFSVLAGETGPGYFPWCWCHFPWPSDL